MTAAGRPVADLAAFLDGGWALRRLGWDAQAGKWMRLAGQARFTSCAEGLAFEERGTLTLGTYRGEAVQRYRFRLLEPAVAEVRFEDGRLFHRLDLSAGVAQVRHDCAPDLYRGRYRVLGPDRLALAWAITGPRKRLMLATLFTRTIPAGLSPGAEARASCGPATA